MLYTSVLSLLALVSSASAIPAATLGNETVSRLCGSVDPPAHLLVPVSDDDARVAAATSPLVVNTYVHVITSTAKKGRYTRQQINQQIAVMNNSYGPYGITFSLKSVEFTVNDVYATSAPTATDVTYKRQLRKGNYGDLNLYFLSDLGTGTGILGYCLFPTNAAKGSTAFIRDGCVNQADSLPGGSLQNFNMGGTATHETGHWFGLFHVFQGNDCSVDGDMVGDTPRQKTDTSGCPVNKDTCPNRPGKDNIHNYMDYSYDSCYNSFSEGQRKRMRAMYAQYRAGK